MPITCPDRRRRTGSRHAGGSTESAFVSLHQTDDNPAPAGFIGWTSASSRFCLIAVLLISMQFTYIPIGNTPPASASATFRKTVADGPLTLAENVSAMQIGMDPHQAPAVHRLHLPLSHEQKRNLAASPASTSSAARINGYSMRGQFTNFDGTNARPRRLKLPRAARIRFQVCDKADIGFGSAFGFGNRHGFDLSHRTALR